MDLIKMKKTAAALDKERKPVTRKKKRRGTSKEKIVDLRKSGKPPQSDQKDENASQGTTTEPGNDDAAQGSGRKEDVGQSSDDQNAGNENPAESTEQGSTSESEENKVDSISDPEKSPATGEGNSKPGFSVTREPHVPLRWLHELDPGLYKTYKSLPKDNRDRVQTALSSSDHAYLSKVANLFDISLRDILEVMTGQLRKKYGSKIKELRLREINMEDF